MAGTVEEHYARLVQDAHHAVDQHNEAATIRIQVGSATCENAAGAPAVLAEFRKLLAASGRSDITVSVTGCTGRCSREPIVSILQRGVMPVTYQQVDIAKARRIFQSHVLEGKRLDDLLLAQTDAPAPRYQLLICGGDACHRKRDNNLQARLEAAIRDAGLGPDHTQVLPSNCFGLCRLEDVGKVAYVLVRPDNLIYRIASDEDLAEIVRSHLLAGRPVERLQSTGRPFGQRFVELYGDLAFFSRQSRIALRNCGLVDPESIQEYIYSDGFRALATVLQRNDPAWVIQEITRSNLRGRGGAGYPTGLKWEGARSMPAHPHYIICNADEGDPGAFMDRDMLESDPYSVVEGMLIGGFAIGASQGFFYIRAEYPMAIARVEKALAQCRKQGLLGQNILGSEFSFDLEIRLGAGAFVCGEETALIASIEGSRGWPRVRPPYPTQQGLWGKPTVINNVETFANVPAVIDYGADWFAQIGTQKSGGTKVFALAGKVRHTGLVEVPMGTTLREIVLDIGGGTTTGKQIKAIQTGGPAGGCIPFAMADTIVDFDSLTQAGSIMGSGGMIVMDEDDCMVDIARFFMTFSQDESCGQCTPCREGTMRMLEILDRIATARGTMEDLDKLERLGKLMKKASLCGLGRAAANPILSTLRHFRHEYLAHIQEKRCPSGRCSMSAPPTAPDQEVARA